MLIPQQIKMNLLMKKFYKSQNKKNYIKIKFNEIINNDFYFEFDFCIFNVYYLNFINFIISILKN